MTYWFDRCVAVRLARMLDAFDGENSVKPLDERFEPTTRDVDWITELSKDNPKPVIITADEAQRRNPQERAVWASSGLTVIFLKGGFNNLDIHTQAIKLLTLWLQIVKETSSCREPTAFEISSAARKVDRLCKTIDLLRH